MLRPRSYTETAGHHDHRLASVATEETLLEILGVNMEMTLKTGDNYCIADLIVESHGIMLNDGRDHPRRVKEDDITSDGYLEVRKPDLMIPLNQLGQFWLNTEPRNHCMNVWYLVYPAWMDEQKFQTLIKTEVTRVCEMRVKMYESLLANSKTMLERLGKDDWNATKGYSRTIIVKDNP